VLEVLKVARTPRTEQCARPACPRPRPVHAPEGTVLELSTRIVSTE